MKQRTDIVAIVNSDDNSPPSGATKKIHLQVGLNRILPKRRISFRLRQHVETDEFDLQN